MNKKTSPFQLHEGGAVRPKPRPINQHDRRSIYDRYAIRPALQPIARDYAVPVQVVTEVLLVEERRRAFAAGVAAARRAVQYQEAA